jgi:hypothetical protein
MAELDDEVLHRAARWCAEAGRQAGPALIRRALSGLSWDELLAVKALLAGPPPARPLGPFALADIARGAPADVAAEREREGRYAPEEAEEAADGDALPAPPPPPRPSRRGGRGRARPSFVVRRARDRAPAAAPAAPALPPLEELFRAGGRAELERLVRRHGGRRVALLAALGAGWAGPAGTAPGDADLDALLQHHGLARAYARRERDEMLHAVRVEGGVKGRAAARLGLDPATLDAALARVGGAEEAERIRDERRRDLRGRATLAERARLLLEEGPRLLDLGLAGEFEADLRARLPEHVRALREAGLPGPDGLARSLSLPAAAAVALAGRVGIDLGAGASWSRAGRDGAPPSGGTPPPRPPRRAGPGPRPEFRPAPRRDRPARSPRPATGGPRPASSGRGPRRPGPPASARPGAPRGASSAGGPPRARGPGPPRSRGPERGAPSPRGPRPAGPGGRGPRPGPGGPRGRPPRPGPRGGKPAR